MNLGELVKNKIKIAIMVKLAPILIPIGIIAFLIFFVLILYGTSYIKNGTRSIGVEVTATDTGEIIITNVAENSLADIAGLSVGDIILEINNVSVLEMTVEEIEIYLNDVPSTSVEITIDRDGEILTFNIIIQEIILKSFRDYGIYTQFALPNNKNCEITSGFGLRIHPKYKEIRFHNGIDIKVPLQFDQGVYAAASGIVTQVLRSVISGGVGAGNLVRIEHFESNVLFRTEYFHLKFDSIPVSVGDYVERGQKIGEIGATGGAVGAHLHFGVYLYERYYGDDYIDPGHTLKEELNTYIDPIDIFQGTCTFR